MMKKFAMSIIALALALAMPMGAAFAATSTGGDAPELTRSADTTAAAQATDQADPAQAPATSPATGAMLIAVAGGTVAMATGAGAAASRLRK